MDPKLEEIVSLAAHAGTAPTATPIPGVILIQGEVPEAQLAAVYEPMIGFTVQGAKTISLGGHTVRMDGPSYFVIPTEVPATGRVHQGGKGRPYLSLGLRLNPSALLDVLKDAPPGDGGESSAPLVGCAATEEFVDAWLRMLRLLRDPAGIPALAPLFEREILYRVLMGPQGWRLRRISQTRGIAAKVRDAIAWIRKHRDQPIAIGRMAERAGMGVTTFHRQFKQITGLSPIQFQKQLRLLEARKLLVHGDRSVAEAAYEVGYESPSQFNREYARFFGLSPARDAKALRVLG